MAGTNEDWVLLAVIGGARGNRGEVFAESHTSGPERFAAGQSFWLRFPGESGEPRPGFQVENAWVHNGRLILKFAGYESIGDAERLRGASLVIPESERPALGEDEFYFSDLVGCSVRDLNTGLLVGTVVAWETLGASELLIVKDPDDQEILVPLARAICEQIDIPGRRIGIRAPDGLLDLNRKSGSAGQ